MTAAFIFDFDGTLVDSEQAINQCFQRITKQLAPERIDYAKNILIGPPLRNTASEILGPDNQDSLDEFVKLFIAMHDEQVIEHTQPYPDVIQVLKHLHKKNIPMAVATNKRLAPTKKLIDYFSWNHYFQFIECSNSHSKNRNKEQMIKQIITTNSIFKKSFYIGDTVNDAVASKTNNLRFIQASYGYGRKECWKNIDVSYKIKSLAEIIKLLNTI